jgi:rhamnose utilization protein RhaD (predicted bifunctional aldolase and dehydrogenase)
VLVLASHGLVVGGADTEQAEQRLQRVLERLQCARQADPVLPAQQLARLEMAARASGWRLPHDPAVHALALDADRLRQAQAGVLYPDHVVFLGGAMACGEPAVGRGDATDAPACLAWPGQGVVVRPDLGEAAEAMLSCWAEVIARLPAGMRPVCLPAEEVEALGQWEAERFRRGLSR